MVSTNNPYNFTATENAEYVANFELDEYVITATADPAAGGTVSGGGTFAYGQKTTLTAKASEGYVFDYWSTKDAPNISLSKSASFKVDVAGTQEYVAHFRQILIEGKDSERIPNQAYTDNPATPEVKVYLDGVDEALIERANYTVGYSDNVNAGTAKITVTLTDPWKGTGVARSVVQENRLVATTCRIGLPGSTR